MDGTVDTPAGRARTVTSPAERAREDARHRRQESRGRRHNIHRCTEPEATTSEDSDDTGEVEPSEASLGPASGNSSPRTVRTPSPPNQAIEVTMARAFEQLTRAFQHQTTLTAQIAHQNAAPKPYVPRMEVPKFRGDRDRAQVWLNQFEAAALTNRWDDRCRLMSLRAAMREDAEIWFEAKYASLGPASYADFLRDFRDLWISDDYVRTMKEKFFRMAQREDESLLNFLHRLQRHRHEIPSWITEGDLLGRAQGGLLSRYQQRGLGLETTLAEFETKARLLVSRESVKPRTATKVSESRSRRDEPKRGRDRRSRSASPRQTHSDRREERPRERAPQDRRGERERRPRESGRPRDNQRDYRPRPEPGSERPRLLESDAGCYHCSEVGHFVRNCPQKVATTHQQLSGQRSPLPRHSGGASARGENGGFGRNARSRHDNWRNRRHRSPPQSKQSVQGSSPPPRVIPEPSAPSPSRRPTLNHGPSLERIQHPVVIDGRLYRALIDTGGGCSAIPLDLAIRHKLPIVPTRMEIVHSDGQESSRVIGDVPDCEVTIGNSTVRFAMLVMDGLTRPIVGHDVIASLDLTINARARVLVPTSPTLLRQLRQAQQRSGASMAEGVASRPYTPFRASPRDRDIYRHGRVTELLPVPQGQREKVRRAVRRRQAGPTVSPARPSDTWSTTSPGPSQAISSSPAPSVVRGVPPVFRSAEEEEWFYETRDMEVDNRECPDYEEEAAAMVRIVGPEKPVANALPQPQPWVIPGLQLGTVAVTSARRRILPQVVTAVKFDVPAGATGVLEVRLHPGYAHLNLEVLMGIVDTRNSTMKVPVLNHSDMAQVLDKSVPLIEVRASNFIVLDDIDYDSESGEEPSRPSEVQMAAFEATTESTYTEAERIALQRATPEDRQRWCDTLA